MSEKKFPRLLYNRISYAGILTAVIALIIMTFLYIVDVYASKTNPYFGIFLYMIMPIFLVGGMLFIPLGMYFKWRRWKRTGTEEVPKWPLLDLNDATQRNASIVFVLGTIIFLGVSAVGSYEAFHYSESVTFCGKLCHVIMKPEYTAYSHSPHARVACVACHVGPGADWFARSKLSGAYQVYATLANKYPRPIPTPIANLRPAQETCEQCHWPEKFFGSRQNVYNHYMYDKENTHWPINMLMKIGGHNVRSGEAIDIHWHIHPDIDVLYIPRDSNRQDIPWVKVVNHRTGEETVYQDENNPISEKEIAAAKPRIMDCVDCHNRPSHIFNSPDHAIDLAISSGMINSDLPEIKKIAVETMVSNYDTENEALVAIAQTINAFYRENYPKIFDSLKSHIDEAIEAIKNEFSRSIFPEMKVRWDNYPDNIGHFNWPGCMRCHEGNHTDQGGTAITHQCEACHAILVQGSDDRAITDFSPDGQEFIHPVDIEGLWQEMGCYECHTGQQP
jgi:hypothetical protein